LGVKVKGSSSGLPPCSAPPTGSRRWQRCGRPCGGTVAGLGRREWGDTPAARL